MRSDVTSKLGRRASLAFSRAIKTADFGMSQLSRVMAVPVEVNVPDVCDSRRNSTLAQDRVRSAQPTRARRAARAGAVERGVGDPVGWGMGPRVALAPAAGQGPLRG